MIPFRNYRLEKAGLLKSQKSPLSVHWWTVNMLKCPRFYLNLHGSFFVIFLSYSCHRVSMCNENVSIFQILLKQIFLSWFALRMMKIMTKILRCRFKQSFRPFNMLTVDKCPERGLFMHLSDPALCTSEVRIFFKVLQILCRFRICWKKFRNFFLVLRQVHLNWWP